MTRFLPLAALCGLLSGASASVADPGALSCTKWLGMNGGERTAALRAGTESAVETVQPIFAGMRNEKAILESVRTCMQAAELTFSNIFDSLCETQSNVELEDLFARGEPISERCADEAVRLSE